MRRFCIKEGRFSLTLLATSVIAMLVFSSISSYGQASGQSVLNFPRGFSSTDLPSTGFAIVNPGPTSALVAYTLYGAAGQVLATSSQTIPARGQVPKLGLGATELFAQATADGWVQATSTTPGLQGFWLGGDFVSFADGAEAAGTAAELIFPLVAGQTEINVVNPNTSSITVTFRLFGANGVEVAPSRVQTLTGHGFLQSRSSSLFSGPSVAQGTHIRVTCPGTCTGTSVLSNYLVSPSWGVLNAVDAASTLTVANFPHVISGVGAGGNYTTVIGVTNLTPNAQNVTLTFTPASGAAQSVTQLVPGSGGIRDTAQNFFNLPSGFSDGWIKVTGTAPITGFVAYGESVQGGMAIVPVQGAPSTTMLFAHIADLPPWYTGVALLNSGTTNATVEVYAMSPAGSLIGGADNIPSARFTLSAGTKRAALLSEWIPQTQQRTGDGGFVFVRSSVPLYGLELFFNRSLTIFSNVAGGVIAPGITFTPPAAGPPPPVITQISPNSVSWGQTALIQLTGTGMNGVTGVEFSDSRGLRIVGNISATSTSVSFALAIGSDAGPGVRTIAVVNPNWRSNAVTFTIRGTPQITSITPSNGQSGSSAIDLQIGGTNLETVTSLDFSPVTGVTISNLNATSTSVTARLQLAATAAQGTRSVTVNSPSGRSNALLFRVDPAPAVPAAPSNLRATVAPGNQINLSWTDNSTNETGFRIEMKTGANGTYGEIATAPANGTGAEFTGFSASTTYYFRVRAYNDVGNSGYSNEAAATTPAPPTTTATLYITTSLTGPSSVTFQGQTWITGYEHTFTLSPGTYEMTGTVGANGTVLIAFANGGGLLGTGGVVPGSLRSTSGAYSQVSACNAVWVSTGSAQSFRLQFTVTLSTSAACQTGQ